MAPSGAAPGQPPTAMDGLRLLVALDGAGRVHVNR